MIVLFSDGGGKRDVEAGAGTIVESGDKALRLVTYLGGATNNEAEICGGLVGFAAIQVLVNAGMLHAQKLRWVCDSEYVLKSATSYIHAWQKNGWKTAAKKPVKNQGLWRTYLSLSAGMDITPEHVYGHQGHPENELCDAAASWAQQEGRIFLETSGEGAIVSIEGQQWIVLDGRSTLECLRSDNPSEEERAYFFKKLEGLGLAALPAAEPPREVPSRLVRLLEEVEKEARQSCPEILPQIAEIKARAS